MSCKKCACDITENDIEKMNTKEFNQLLNDIENGEICSDTGEKLKVVISKNKTK